MRRDIVFFVRGIPEEFHLWDKGVFFVTFVDPSYEKGLAEASKQVPVLEMFLRMRTGTKLVCFGIRTDVEEESEALEKSWNSLQGIIDGLAFVMEGQLPDVCEVALIREGDNPDAQLKLYRPVFWAHLKLPKSDSMPKWASRQKALLDKLLPLFDVVAGQRHKYRTELAFQLAYSSRMFRCGAQSGAVGVEYLCKFSALEGLVCGPLLSEKQKNLKHRIAKLFSKSGRKVMSDVNQLWELRCVASHQARAFYDSEIPDSKWIQEEVCLVEYYLIGVMVFALDNIDRVKTINGLWSGIGNYSLPDFAILERPRDIPKTLLVNFIRPLALTSIGAGQFIDTVFRAQASSTAVSSPSSADPL